MKYLSGIKARSCFLLSSLFFVLFKTMIIPILNIRVQYNHQRIWFAFSVIARTGNNGIKAFAAP